jgi:hypothetical protein
MRAEHMNLQGFRKNQQLHYHFPLQNKLGEDKEKRRGLTAVADDQQFEQVVVVFGHLELGL